MPLWHIGVEGCRDSSTHFTSQQQMGLERSASRLGRFTRGGKSLVPTEKGHWEGATAGLDVLQVSKNTVTPAETEHVILGSVVTKRTTLSMLLI